jgi:hypothetical protein
MNKAEILVIDDEAEMLRLLEIGLPFRPDMDLEQHRRGRRTFECNLKAGPDKQGVSLPTAICVTIYRLNARRVPHYLRRDWVTRALSRGRRNYRQGAMTRAGLPVAAWVMPALPA